MNLSNPSLRSSGRLGLALAAMLSALTLTAQTYRYDSVGRLTTVIYPDGSGISYRYDSAGNRLSQGPLSLEGSYFGTLGSGLGNWAMFVRPDNSAVLIAYLNATKSVASVS